MTDERNGCGVEGTVSAAVRGSSALFGLMHAANPNATLFGVEASVFAVALCLAAAIMLLVLAHRKGHVHAPPWRR